MLVGWNRRKHVRWWCREKALVSTDVHTESGVDSEGGGRVIARGVGSEGRL